MKILKREDIDKVDPKFRQMVLDAWEKGEEVPAGVALLSSAPLNEQDLAFVEKHAKELSEMDKGNYTYWK